MGTASQQRHRASGPTIYGRSGAGRRRPTAAARQARVRRRRLRFLVAFAALAGVVALIGLNPLKHAVQEITLPLRHEDIIRQQARDKNLDQALIAAVIYRESKFRDVTSDAGAKGMMQILPDTARFIATKSGGTEFEEGDLADPQITLVAACEILEWR